MDCLYGYQSHVKVGVNLGGELSNLDLEAILDLHQNLLVSLCLTLLATNNLLVLSSDETDCKTLGTKSSSSSYSVKVGVLAVGEVEVDHKIYSLNIHTSTKKIG